MALINRFILLILCSLLLSVNSTATSSNLTATELSAIYTAFDTTYATYASQAAINYTMAELMIQYIEYAVRGALLAIDGNQWDVFTVTGSPAVGDIACAG
jgi:hypothetical protein